MGKWSEDKAWKWLNRIGEIRGFNYVPRNAVNSTEMWQAETFEEKIMDQELSWAKQYGLNGARVFLPYAVWRQDPDGFKVRFDRFLEIAAQHNIRIMPVLFDDCAFSGKQPYLGKQSAPIPGVHNSGWTPSPGVELADTQTRWPELREYVDDLLLTFSDDHRILIWDLYNEPGNSERGERSLPLVEASFEWARELEVSQPLTVGAWIDFQGSMSKRLYELSDIITFHYYGDPGSEEGSTTLHSCLSYGRPVLCTEWLKRQDNNRFENMLPLFREHRIGSYFWGLVAGKTQTYMHWGSEEGAAIPAIWQHDLLRSDGTPYDEREAEFLQKFSTADSEMKF
ncbi:hypothetical protein FHS19_001691 [Paenibacillus rhizosphaerae]|uniref:1,4-beta-xylanase n=1 Tax=Paenibacillus rhizosphaerae TaxID=297318 RepID=A0A839TQL2_9BACL|nr:1,4-beta-xylanase [Paenibacillus rhizosphaerae]MBB3127037.1 hypothetical protein [Paenibacillus rhizosphaerae]